MSFDTFFFCKEIMVLHFTHMACFIPLRESGDRAGFLSSPSFVFLGFRSLVSLATMEKSAILFKWKCYFKNKHDIRYLVLIWIQLCSIYASEKRAFLLYYATPLLSSYLPSDHLFLLMLLTGGVFRLLKLSIAQGEWQEACTYLKLFTAQSPVFYGKICEGKNI